MSRTIARICARQGSFRQDDPAVARGRRGIGAPMGDRRAAPLADHTSLLLMNSEMSLQRSATGGHTADQKVGFDLRQRRLAGGRARTFRL